MRTVERRSLAAEDRDLAKQIGTKLRTARHAAGLTQQQVAAGRYTKAYVSALENGLIKPSMAALRFLAVRLGTTPSELLAESDTRWARLDSELRLAAGDWQSAADGFGALLDAAQGAERGRVLIGLAEAMHRLGRGTEAVAIASEAAELLGKSGLVAEARQARYWLAASHHQADNPAEARRLLEQLISDDTEAAPLGADVRVRVLIALASAITHGGEPKLALTLLEEARGIGADLDDRRRGALLHSLALGYRETGDMEAAVRNGLQSLALYRSAEAEVESASIENELALIFVGLGNLAEARRHAAAARALFEKISQDSGLAHVSDTEGQIALAAGDADAAGERAADAVELARRSGNHKAEISGLLTQARAKRLLGDTAQAAAILGSAAELARSGPKPRLRDILSEWSELMAESGDVAKAYELSREALALV
jgi:HTH-type transcriptional regulator, quorum sensing regulator NprR